MSNQREYCQKCHRALKGCICEFASLVENKSPVTILRHPSETNKQKGTADLLRLSLSNIKILEGEEFQQSDVLKSGHENILVYTAVDSDRILESQIHEGEKFHFIFIDGTWKKAFKIFKLNTFLHSLKLLQLNPKEESLYTGLRKQRENGLSTYEAVYQTLCLTQPSIQKSPLMPNLERFITYLKTFQS
jgi:DTW domain-containing protein YfiP